MGVSTVLLLSGRGITTHQQQADLEQRIAALGAEKTGVWSVSSTTYHATSVLTNAGLTTNRALYVMQNSEEEDSCFAFTGNGACVTGDRDLGPILAQLSTFYTQRKAMSVEVKGPRYQFGDFLIKPGVVSLGPNAHSNILEVEYQPCCVASQCWNLVNQMLAQIMDQPSVRRPMPSGHADSNIIYDRSHTMQQYQTLFNEIRQAPR